MFCRLKASLVLLALLGGSSIAPAAWEGAFQTDLPPGGFRIRRWTTDEGLPQDRIGCLKQTSDGYLWIGTWSGLARFDGIKFTVFNRLNTPELSSDAISGLVEDTEGTLWIGTRDGLVCYRDQHFRRVTLDASVPDRSIWQLVKAQAGGVWVQAGDDVMRVHNGLASRPRRGGMGQRILSLHESADGWLNVFAEGGWFSVSPTGEETRTNGMATAEEGTWQAARFEEQAQRLWIGSPQGFFRLEHGKRVSAGQGLSIGAVDLVWQDRDENVWANVKEKGLFRRKGEVWENIPLGDEWTRQSTICIQQDFEGNIWLGHDFGLVCLQPRHARTYTVSDGLLSDRVWTVCESADGDIWAGTERGVNRIRRGEVLRLNSIQPEELQRVRCVWPRNQGGIWIGKDYGIMVKCDKEKFTELRTLPFEALPHSLYEDRKNVLWIGTSAGLMTCKENNPYSQGIASPDNVFHDIHSIFDDQQGSLWFGGKGFLACSSASRTNVFTLPPGHEQSKISAIHRDADGVLWLGTENGLIRFQDGQCFAYSYRHGLLEPAVHCILEDDSGYFWLSGRQGIQRIAREQLNAVARGRATSVTPFLVSTADGMVAAETNGGDQPAGWKARDGRLWFPTSRGLLVFDPGDFSGEQHAPQVSIERVRADHEVIFGNDSGGGGKAFSDSNRRISPGHGHVLEFHYTADTLSCPERARFRCCLSPTESEWREEVTERAVSYIDLPPGNYQFEVMAANHHNVWSKTPATFAFSIEPFFWQTWPFYALSGALLLGTAIAVQAYRLRWQHRLLKVEELRALAGERTRIARDLHDDLGGTLTGIALQLEAARQRGHAGPDELALLAGEARALTHDLRELAWATNPRCDNTGSLRSFLGEVAERFCAAASLACRLELPSVEISSSVPARVRHEILVVLKESLTNISRHAGARSVTIQLQLTPHSIQLVIKDDGSGFDPGRKSNGAGLRNLRERVQQAGGQFTIESRPQHGTTTTASFPVANHENTGP